MQLAIGLEAITSRLEAIARRLDPSWHQLTVADTMAARHHRHPNGRSRIKCIRYESM